MEAKDAIKLLDHGTYYGMVFDCAKNRNNFSFDEMNEHLEFTIKNSDTVSVIASKDIPADVREVMRDNLEATFRPAAGGKVDCYEEILEFCDADDTAYIVCTEGNETLYLMTWLSMEEV